MSPMWEKLRRVASIVLMLCFAFWLVACGSKSGKLPRSRSLNLSEVSPPPEIQRLNRLVDQYAPQVSIVSPQPDQVLTDTTVAVSLSVRDLPIFKSALGLGPHLDVLLDNRDFQQVYDVTQPVIFNQVQPGTHSLRVFASRPWDESFKNEGAYAQTTFHVLTKTGENTPRPDAPLLTYHSPLGTFSTEPVLLDFYLHNAPLPLSLLESKENTDWQIRVSVNNESFTMEDWHPVYLKGLKQGRNWIKVEFLDQAGNAVPNLSNSAAYLVDYQPGAKDTLARLLQGDLIAGIDQIVDPNYTANPSPAPIVSPSPQEEVAPIDTPAPEPIKTEVPVLEEAPTPKKAPKFQFFKKRAKSVTPVVAPEPSSPAAVETVPDVVNPSDTEKVPPPNPEPLTPIPSPPGVEPTPIEPPTSSAVDSPVQEEIKASETPKAVPPALEPKMGRFQLLKSRLEQPKTDSPVAVPDTLNGDEPTAAP